MFNHVDHGITLSQLGSETLPNGRYYWVEGDPSNKFPSATTVLQVADKGHLEKWKARIGEAEAAKVTTQATNRGSEVHLIAEDYLNNVVDWRAKRMPINVFTFQSLKPILDKHVNNIYFQEAPLYSTRLKTAGRVDLIAEFDGKLSIIDFKTSRRPKKPEWIENYYMQEAFYAAAFYERTGVAIKQLVTLVMVDDDYPQVFIEQPLTWLPGFISLRKKYQEIHGI